MRPTVGRRLIGLGLLQARSADGWAVMCCDRAVSMTGGPIMASYAVVNRHFSIIVRGEMGVDR